MSLQFGVYTLLHRRSELGHRRVYGPFETFLLLQGSLPPKYEFPVKYARILIDCFSGVLVLLEIDNRGAESSDKIKQRRFISRAPVYVLSLPF